MSQNPNPGAYPPPPGQGGQPGYGGQLNQGDQPSYGGYAPAPGTDDAYGARQPVARPKAVDTAVKLMYAGAGLWLLNLIVPFLMKGQIEEQVREQLEASGEVVDQSLVDTTLMGSLIFGVVLGLVGVGLWLLHAWANGKGMSWARITGTILGVLSVLSTLLGLVGMGMGIGAGGNVLSMILSILGLLISLGAMWFMWRPENKAFYGQR